MGTAKRERQKTNRQLRLEELQRQQRRDRTKRRVITWAVIIVVAGAALYGVSLLVSGGDDDDAATSADVPRPSTARATTTIVPADARCPAPPSPATTPCPAADGTSPRTITFAEPPPMCIDAAKTYTATVDDQQGRVHGRPRRHDGPADGEQLRRAVAGTTTTTASLCHRIITGFVVQCGDPTGTGLGPEPGLHDPRRAPRRRAPTRTARWPWPTPASPTPAAASSSSSPATRAGTCRPALQPVRPGHRGLRHDGEGHGEPRPTPTAEQRRRPRPSPSTSRRVTITESA